MVPEDSTGTASTIAKASPMSLIRLFFFPAGMRNQRYLGVGFDPAATHRKEM